MRKQVKDSKPTLIHVLPMELRVGDRVIDETGEWEVTRPPFTTGAGRNAHANVRKVGHSQLTNLRTWGAHERVSVRRVSAAEGKP
jgi:hypothetical protein